MAPHGSVLCAGYGCQCHQPSIISFLPCTPCLLITKKATGSVELLGLRAADTVDQATWKLSWAQGHGRGS